MYTLPGPISCHTRSDAHNSLVQLEWCSGMEWGPEECGLTDLCVLLALRSQMPHLVLQAATPSCTLKNENAGK